jgi:bifunctional non-homologous end joining protein LigD
LKWDGFRALALVERGQVRLFSKNGRDFTRRFPRLQGLAKYFHEGSIVDGEICVFDERGYPRFENVSARRAAHTFVAFDVLRLDCSRDLLQTPLETRQQILERLVPRDDEFLMRSLVFTNGENLFAQCEHLGVEGIVAKDTRSLYYPARRSRVWLKVKTSYGRRISRAVS